MTTGTNGGPTETDYQNGESVESWVTRHMESVTDVSCSESTLESTWEADGGKITVTSEREQYETDAEFVTRHEIAALEAMLTSPPAA